MACLLFAEPTTDNLQLGVTSVAGGAQGEFGPLPWVAWRSFGTALFAPIFPQDLPRCLGGVRVVLDAGFSWAGDERDTSCAAAALDVRDMAFFVVRRRTDSDGPRRLRRRRAPKQLRPPCLCRSGKVCGAACGIALCIAIELDGGVAEEVGGVTNDGGMGAGGAIHALALTGAPPPPPEGTCQAKGGGLGRGHPNLYLAIGVSGGSLPEPHSLPQQIARW